MTEPTTVGELVEAIMTPTNLSLEEAIKKWEADHPGDPTDLLTKGLRARNVWPMSDPPSVINRMLRDRPAPSVPEGWLVVYGDPGTPDWPGEY